MLPYLCWTILKIRTTLNFIIVYLASVIQICGVLLSKIQILFDLIYLRQLHVTQSPTLALQVVAIQKRGKGVNMPICIGGQLACQQLTPLLIREANMLGVHCYNILNLKITLYIGCHGGQLSPCCSLEWFTMVLTTINHFKNNLIVKIMQSWYIISIALLFNWLNVKCGYLKRPHHRKAISLLLDVFNSYNKNTSSETSFYRCSTNIH